MKIKKIQKNLQILISFVLLINFPTFGESIYKNNDDIKNENQKEKQKNYISEKEIIEPFKFSQLKKLLITNNEELQIIQSQIKQAKRDLNSKFSAWYPRFNLTSDQLPKYTTSDTRQTLNENTSSNQLKLGVSAKIEWDLINPKRKLEIKISKEKLQNLNYIYKRNLEDLYFKTLEIYFSILSSEQEIKKANQSLKISELTVNEFKNRFKNGISNKLELLEVKTQLNRDKINLLNKIDQLELNQNRFYEILNLSKKIRIEDDQLAHIYNIWDFDETESLRAGLENSYKLKINQKNIDINKKEALSLISGKKPSFVIYNDFSISSANGETGVVEPDYNKLTKSNSNTVGLKFNLNLFDGGNIRQKYLSLIERNKELELELNLTKIGLKKEIIDKLTQYKSIKKKIVLAKDQLDFATESLDIALKRLEAGLGTQREVLNIQGDLIESETNFIEALKSYKILIANLNKLTTLNPQNICTINKKEKENLEFLVYLKNKNLIPHCNNLI